MKYLITGGFGFIGSALVRQILKTEPDSQICVFDCLTYAANVLALEGADSDPRFTHVLADINNKDAVRSAFQEFQPDVVFHLAAETHVDRSITNIDRFVHSNVLGTLVLLEQALLYGKLQKFVHVSTDEVYGSLKLNDWGRKFTETSTYKPSSPYSASKASSDHFALAYAVTFGLPVVITHCSNNYGPYQNREKLIPKTILNALEMMPIPVYGKGENIRDWIHVDDHVEALRFLAKFGNPSETYNIGGNAEISNIRIVEEICKIVDDIQNTNSRSSLITFVEDRKGHDLRYAVDSSKIENLGWDRQKPVFWVALRNTVEWYILNSHKCK